MITQVYILNCVPLKYTCCTQYHMNFFCTVTENVVVATEISIFSIENKNPPQCDEYNIVLCFFCNVSYQWTAFSCHKADVCWSLDIYCILIHMLCGAHHREASWQMSSNYLSTWNSRRCSYDLWSLILIFEFMCVSSKLHNPDNKKNLAIEGTCTNWQPGCEKY